MNKDQVRPFNKPYWNGYQVLAWVYLRNEDLLKLFDDDVDDFGTRTTQDNDGKDVEVPMDAPGILDITLFPIQEGIKPYFDNFKMAMEYLINALANEKVTCYGRKNGEGDINPIPAHVWADGVFYYEDDGVYVTRKDWSKPRTTEWHDIKFKSKEILDLLQGKSLEASANTLLEGFAENALENSNVPDNKDQGKENHWGDNWEYIELEMPNENALNNDGIIKIKNKKTGTNGEFTFSDMGLTKQNIDILMMFSISSFPPILSKKKQAISRLRKKLKNHFGILDDPFRNEGKTYVAKFKFKDTDKEKQRKFEQEMLTGCDFDRLNHNTENDEEDYDDTNNYD